MFTFFDKPFFGLKKDEEYCFKSDTYHILHMKEYLSDANIYTNYASTNLIRTKVINVYGNEMEPRSSLDMPPKLKIRYRYSLPEKTHIFFSRTMMHIFFEMGKTFNCFF